MSVVPDRVLPMTAESPALIDPPDGYTQWLADLKRQVYAAQQRAALAVNNEMLLLHWRIGNDILIKQRDEGWREDHRSPVARPAHGVPGQYGLLTDEPLPHESLRAGLA